MVLSLTDVERVGGGVRRARETGGERGGEWERLGEGEREGVINGGSEREREGEQGRKREGRREREWQILALV